ncbi:hypothetical protein EV363DRAFT_1393296 [Boletus edulis]|nr:hypothetical protein EV363DRAFT_1393296 [Boletus edulis]
MYMDVNRLLDIKSYPDVVYFNYPTLGVSFQFSPRNGYKPVTGLRREQLKDDDLQLEAADIYKCPRRATPVIEKDTTGKEFVAWLGEPSRKGGGTGPSSGSIHIWCEWSQQGIMVEFGGNDARGPQAWERGGNAVWRVVTVFAPK